MYLFYLPPFYQLFTAGEGEGLLYAVVIGL